MIFVALFLVSCSMVFLQLGFTNVGRGAGDTHYMFSLIPVVVTAFLLGPSWGMLQGAGLVACRRQGKWCRYSLVPDAMCQLAGLFGRLAEGAAAPEGKPGGCGRD